MPLTLLYLHIYLEAHHLHTKKEKLIHKRLTATKDKRLNCGWER